MSNIVESMGTTDVFVELLEQRTVETTTAYLLPYLKRGQYVLDLGCGTGSITRGIAELVYPGMVLGIDRDEGQIVKARVHQEDEERGNIVYTQALVEELTIMSWEFDVVHTHALLMYMLDPVTIINQVMRFVAPGGILAAREMDVQSSYLAPGKVESGDVFRMLGAVLGHEGGHTRLGRRLKSVALKCGLDVVYAGATSDFFESKEEVDFLKRFLLGWGLSAEMEQKAGQYGYSGLEFVRMRNQVEDWAETPGAVGCFNFGEVIGKKGAP